MKSTVDTFTGKRFRYNELVEYQGYIVPSRTTARSWTHLAADRMPAARKDLLSND